MDWGARLGLIHQRAEMVCKGPFERLNGLGCPFGIDTSRNMYLSLIRGSKWIGVPGWD